MRTLGKDDAAFNFQFEANLIFFLKRDVESAGIENLPEFNLHRAQDFILIEMRADRLPNLGEQFVFLGPALSLVHDHVVLEG